MENNVKESPRRRARRQPQARNPRPQRSVEQILASPFCSVREVSVAFPLKRTTLHRLLARQVIASGLIHADETRKRGTRVVDVASVRAYLASVVNGGET
jgi:hypothetical protein